MAKPKFYLEPRQSIDGLQAINMYYSFNGQRLQYYTGIRTEMKYFRPECNTSDIIKPLKSTAPFAGQLNSKLIDIKTDAIKIVNDTKGDNLNVKYIRTQLDLIYKPKTNKQIAQSSPKVLDTFITFFKTLIDDSKTGKRLISGGKNSGARYTRNTYKNYSVTLAAVQRYLNYRALKDLPLESINKAFYEDFRNYCYEVEQKEKSTFGSYIKDIKTVMTESNTPSFNTKDFITPTYEADTLYLRTSEIDKIESFDFSDYKKFINTNKGKVSYLTLNKTRDLFLIGCYTGLRFGDFSKLDTKSIEGNFINLKLTKTGSRVTIPIMKKLHPVLKKYPDIIPSISLTKFNIYIKHVAQLAGLTEAQTVKDTKGNTHNESTSPLYSLISSHCCRRSYATNMFKAGVPNMLIMSATGHKTETSFLKYIRANNDDKAKLLAETLEKLGL